MTNGPQCPLCGNDFDPLHPCKCPRLPADAVVHPNYDVNNGGDEIPYQEWVKQRKDDPIDEGAEDVFGGEPTKCANCGHERYAHPVSPELQCPEFRARE